MDMELHWESDCPRIEVICPEGCGERQCRGQIQNHLLSCPEVKVPCGVNGCEQILKRRDLQVHKEEQATTHQLMGLLEDQRRQFLETTAQLTRDIESIRWQLPVAVPFEFTFTGMTSKLAGETRNYDSPVFPVNMPNSHFWSISIRIAKGKSWLGVYIRPHTCASDREKFSLYIGGSFLTLVHPKDGDVGNRTKTFDYTLSSCIPPSASVWGWEKIVEDVKPFIDSEGDCIFIKGLVKLNQKVVMGTI